MPKVWIPTLMRKLTDGQAQVEVEGSTIREVVESLDAAFPGIKARLCTEEGRVRPNIAVAIDGQITPQGMRTKVGAQSEVNFIPAVGGG
jgi:molybdopterin converting factor small subunit